MLHRIKKHSRCANWWLITSGVLITIGTIMLFASIINHIITNIK